MFIDHIKLHNNKKKRNYLALIISILICESVGIIGSLLTIQSFQSWYPNLPKPWYTPPNWVFGPTWTILYALMGISVYLIWKNSWPTKKSKKAIIVFSIQLTLNGAWTPVFFGLKNIFLALIIAILMWITILITIILFYDINKKSAYLLTPYIIWVTIATTLNYNILILLR